MSTTFKCPSCGGPLDYDGGDVVTVRCPFCSNSVIVPEELRARAGGGAASQGATPPPPAAAAALAPPPPAATTPEAIRAQIRENRRSAREERRQLRHKLRETRRRQE